MANTVGGPTIPSQEGNKPSSGIIPWRRATTPRTAISVSTSKTMTTSTQNVAEQIEGTGYITGVNLEVVCTTAANAAAVAFQPDGPYSVLDSISFSDSGGESLNLSGFELYLANLYCGFNPHSTLDSGSSDTNIYQAVTGAVATGGSFRFHLMIPIAINTRNFLGLLGNQDRAMKYTLRSDIAASTSVYSTSPTTLGTVTINRTYMNVTVPSRSSADGTPQQQYPPKFGVIHYLTRSVISTAPVGGSTVNHYLPRIGNTIRFLILVFKSNSTRATAESNAPTRIQFQLGDTPIFQESWQYRRRVMRQRYGFDAPAGVLVYDFASDVFPTVTGGEFGLDWLWTNGLANAQFQITYPSGFGSTANSLTVITDDLLVPPGVDVYAPDGV